MAAHVLVVLTDDQIRDAICLFLNRCAIATSSAKTAEDAFSLLQQFPPLMLLDLTLPDDGAIEVLRVVRDLKLPTEVAVIASDADHSRVLEIVELHPVAIFGRPFDFEEFAEWLNRVFGSPRLSGDEAKDLHRAHEKLRRQHGVEPSK